MNHHKGISTAWLLQLTYLLEFNTTGIVSDCHRSRKREISG